MLFFFFFYCNVHIKNKRSHSGCFQGVVLRHLPAGVPFFPCIMDVKKQKFRLCFIRLVCARTLLYDRKTAGYEWMSAHGSK